MIFNLPDARVVKDLGIYVSDDLKFSFHISKITSAAYSRINCIFRTFTCLQPDFLTRMYCVYVRPLLEYNTPIWSPYMIKDIHQVESVQRYFTRRIPGFRNLTYKERIRRLGLETLQLRRIKFDLMEVYKILNGLVDLDPTQFFTICRDSVTRGNGLKLCVPKSRINVRKYFFCVRVVSIWNFLSFDVVNSVSLDVFKSKIDLFDFSRFISD